MMLYDYCDDSDSKASAPRRISDLRGTAIETEIHTPLGPIETERQRTSASSYESTVGPDPNISFILSLGDPELHDLTIFYRRASSALLIYNLLLAQTRYISSFPRLASYFSHGHKQLQSIPTAISLLSRWTEYQKRGIRCRAQPNCIGRPWVDAPWSFRR